MPRRAATTIARSSRNESRPALLAIDGPILFRTDGPVSPSIPDRHLSSGDLAYLHRVAALQASGGEPVPPSTDEDLEQLRAELIASGAFSEDEPADAGDPAAPAEKE